MHLMALGIAIGSGVVLLAVGLTAWFLYRKYPIDKIYKSKVHLESTFDSVGDPIAIIRTDYSIQRVNRAYVAMVGSTFGKVLNTPCYKILRKRESPCEDCLMKDVLQNTGRTVIERAAHPTVAERFNSITFYPFNRKGGSCDGVVEHFRDITRLEQLKTELEQHNRTLSETSRVLEHAQNKIQAEIALARDVQSGLMPSTIPRIEGVDIRVVYQPVDAVGGDIYDFLTLSRHKLGFFIGDASGHGLAAAFVGTISKMSLYNHSRLESGTAALLERINRDIISNVHTGHYLTGFLGVLDSFDYTFTYTRASHPKPVIIRSSGEVVMLTTPGAFIGILENPRYQQRTFNLQKGDRLYLFTDGIYELAQKDAVDGKRMGYSEFLAILTECNAHPLDEVIPAIQARFTDSVFDDDYTMLAIEITDDCVRDRLYRAAEFEPGDAQVKLFLFSTYLEGFGHFAEMFADLAQNGFGESAIHQVKIGLNELIFNALEHGNQNDAAKYVAVLYKIESDALTMVVIDEGNGFTLPNVPDPTEAENLFREKGRGLILVQRVVSAIRLNKAGNGVMVTIKK